MEYSYTAIVLKKYDIGETDRVYSLFTQEGGKVRAVARGVRKPVAKLAGQLETLTLASVAVMRNRGRGNISSAIAEEYFPNIRNDETALRSALVAVSIVNRRVEEEEIDRELFHLLVSFLRALEIVTALPRMNADEEVRFQEKTKLLFHGFSWKFLERLGYGVEVKSCAVGHELLRGKREYFFSPDMGGVVCVEHREQANIVLPFSENAIKALRVVLANRLGSLSKLHVDTSATRDLDRALKSFFEWMG